MTTYRLSVDLTEDDRALLEPLRVKLGARSHSDAVRMLLRQSTDATPEPARAASKPDKRPIVASRLKGQWKAP